MWIFLYLVATDQSADLNTFRATYNVKQTSVLWICSEAFRNWTGWNLNVQKRKEQMCTTLYLLLNTSFWWIPFKQNHRFALFDLQEIHYPPFRAIDRFHLSSLQSHSFHTPIVGVHKVQQVLICCTHSEYMQFLVLFFSATFLFCEKGSFSVQLQTLDCIHSTVLCTFNRDTCKRDKEGSIWPYRNYLQFSIY